MSLRYFDTHAHLPMLEHASRDEVMARAASAGIDRLVTVSTDVASWHLNQDFARNVPQALFSLGLHPHEAIHWANNEALFNDFFAAGKVPEKCVAIGEIGLDYYYDHSPREIQMAVFEKQLALAGQLNLPVIIHCRDAFRDLFDCFDRVGVGPKAGVMHCFTGNKEEATESVRRGFYISYSGIITFKNAGALRETVSVVPHDRIVIETDCPFLAPAPHRGKPNEPSLLPHTAFVVAESAKLPLATLAEQTYLNALRLFGLN